MKKLLILCTFLLVTVLSYGQEERWLPEKEGKWRFENYLQEKAYKMRNATLSVADNLAYRKNIASLAEWFRQNHPMLKNPKGYDLRALTTYVWGDYTTKSEAEYGIPAEVGFLFELFDSKGGRWTSEPPQYRFSVNNIAGGHGGWYMQPEIFQEDGSRVDASKISKVMEKQRRLCEYLCVSPLKEQPVPGVNIYETYPGGPVKIVVFNPDRPAFWLPVTVKEIADASLEYYSLLQKMEMDRMLFAELKKEIEKLTPEELAAPAFLGNDSNIVLRVNGKGNGIQIMRFNPAYWDKTLPQSAIQFMTFWDDRHTDMAMEEQAKRAYRDYPQMFVNQINWEGVSKQIEKK